MKVVLFCGGLGTRLREHSDTIPKPLVNVGYRPIIWHLMRYYAHYGHRDFVLALGYRGHMLREYFLNYQECMSNDFTLSEGYSSRLHLERTQTLMQGAPFCDFRYTLLPRDDREEPPADAGSVADSREAPPDSAVAPTNISTHTTRSEGES